MAKKMKWDEVKDLNVVFQGAKRLWPRIRAAFTLVFRGHIVTGVPWRSLDDDIAAMKRLDAGPSGAIASLEEAVAKQ